MESLLKWKDLINEKRTECKEGPRKMIPFIYLSFLGHFVAFLHSGCSQDTTLERRYNKCNFSQSEESKT